MAVNGPMATINNGASIIQVNVAKLLGPQGEIDLDGFANPRERAEATAPYQSS